MRAWAGLLKSGDWLMVALGMMICAALFPLAWQAGTAEKVVIRRGGEIFSEFSLFLDRRVDVSGPLGITTVIVDRRRARVAADPGPRQYCVRQGWLAHAGEIAVCAPNQVSVEIQGAHRPYDSLAY